MGIDGTGELTPTLKWRSQLLTSNTTAQPDANGELQRGEATRGIDFTFRLNHRSDEWQAAASTSHTSKGYRNDSGFTNQADIRDFSGNINRIWRNVHSPFGQLNEFWVYLWGSRTDSLQFSRQVSSYLTPGFYIAAGSNTEITLEHRFLDAVRISPDSPLRKQNHLHAEYAVQPAAWWPRFAFNGDVGRLLDYTQDTLRPGVKFSVSSQIRAHRLLEVEPQLSQVILKGVNGIAYRESAAQLLSVLHITATQKLRYIGQQTYFTALGIPSDTRTTHSLTYSWRKSAGTVAYLGVASSKGAQLGNYATKGTELFAKLQIDPQELGWF